MANKITILNVKEALLDERFRQKLPPDLKGDVIKFLGNPSCSCNKSLYKKVIEMAPDALAEYFPTKTVETLPEAPETKNNWSVINCRADELQAALKKLGPGRKEIAVARWQDQVTVIVNELEAVF
jgi:hypothetical protein